MSDEELVRRLRELYQKSAHNQSISNEEWEAIVQATVTIERLTRERDEWKGTAEHLLDIEREWIAANESLAATAKLIEARADAATDLVEMRTNDLHNAIARAEAAERKVEKLRKALKSLLDVFERCETGFTPHLEIRFAVRDSARAALAETEDSHE